VNTGEAHVGVVGAAGGREHTALGDAVNLASRLEGQARAGEVVVGPETYAELPDGTEVEPLGGLRVKGKAAPVEAYAVVSLPDRSAT
jgi:class 3 adenylate cyclase